ncbi:hypothetical protein AMAG_12385 [Allomyces macrogynus ATCC 38327]|uniref:G-patch domain-containing protein n=1 Tax=Allomyces macrogynus (strain ATCC 38327) TaxID=578462 RepID=A0A0L0SZ15_ALLM3|nr:hypothetical protein AMAG_12385 [Allomyces macrogynus ATCC 38327]|eukprot:KNE67650.1 hypothetical protein AMAG_12385 [Allomyces macrogynus ATCC 38327]
MAKKHKPKGGDQSKKTMHAGKAKAAPASARPAADASAPAAQAPSRRATKKAHQLDTIHDALADLAISPHDRPWGDARSARGRGTARGRGAARGNSRGGRGGRGGNRSGGADRSASLIAHAQDEKPKTWRDSHRGLGFKSLVASNDKLNFMTDPDPLAPKGLTNVMVVPEFANEWLVAAPAWILKLYYVPFVSAGVITAPPRLTKHDVEVEKKAVETTAHLDEKDEVPEFWAMVATQDIEDEVTGHELHADDAEVGQGKADGDNDRPADDDDDEEEVLDPAPDPAELMILRSEFDDDATSVDPAHPTSSYYDSASDVDHDVSDDPAPALDLDPALHLDAHESGTDAHDSDSDSAADDDDLFVINTTPAHIDFARVAPPKKHSAARVLGDRPPSPTLPVFAKPKKGKGRAQAVEPTSPSLPVFITPKGKGKPTPPAPTRIADDLAEYDLGEYDDEPMHGMFAVLGRGGRCADAGGEMDEDVSTATGTDATDATDDDSEEDSDDPDDVDDSSSISSYNEAGGFAAAVHSDEDDAITEDYLANLSDSERNDIYNAHVLTWAGAGSSGMSDSDDLFLTLAAPLKKARAGKGSKLKNKADPYGLGEEVYVGGVGAKKGKKGAKARAIQTAVDFDAVEKVIKRFMQDPFEQTQLPPMPKGLRKIAQSMAACYQLKTKALGSKKSKRLQLIKTQRSDYPRGTLAKQLKNLKQQHGAVPVVETWGSKSGAKNSSAAPAIKPTHGYVVGAHAPPIAQDNVGHKILRNFGWAPGETLGVGVAAGGEGGEGEVDPAAAATARRGALQAPLQAVVRAARRGLGT